MVAADEAEERAGSITDSCITQFRDKPEGSWEPLKNTAQQGNKLWFLF